MFSFGPLIHLALASGGARIPVPRAAIQIPVLHSAQRNPRHFPQARRSFGSPDRRARRRPEQYEDSCLRLGGSSRWAFRRAIAALQGLEAPMQTVTKR